MLEFWPAPLTVIILIALADTLELRARSRDIGWLFYITGDWLAITGIRLAIATVLAGVAFIPFFGWDNEAGARLLAAGEGLTAWVAGVEGLRFFPSLLGRDGTTNDGGAGQTIISVAEYIQKGKNRIIEIEGDRRTRSRRRADRLELRRVVNNNSTEEIVQVIMQVGNEMAALDEAGVHSLDELLYSLRITSAGNDPQLRRLYVAELMKMDRSESRKLARRRMPLTGWRLPI